MAFPVTLNGRTYTLTDFEGTNYVDGLPDAFEDFVTHAGDIYNSTSTTSNSIGTGSKTFTVEANKPYQAGTPLRIADAAAPSTNFLDTVVTSYSGTTLVVNSIGYGGSGTKTSWTVNIGGAKTVDGTLGLSQGGTGATDAAGARTNIDVYSKADADSRFLNVSGEASAVTISGNLSVDGGTIKLDGNYPTGTGNVALGDAALDDGSLSGNYNTALGAASFGNLTSGTANLAVGAYAGQNHTTGSYNVFVGEEAAVGNTTGSYNTAVGRTALYSNTTASNATAVGYQAAYNATTGSITAVGTYALYSQTNQNGDTAIGKSAGYNHNGGYYLTAVGHEAAYSNSTGINNTALGAEALVSNTTSINNTAVGYQAGYSNTTSSGRNAYFGHVAGLNSTGSYNTFIGAGAGNQMTTGTKNTILGRYNGNQGGLDIRTTSNNIVLSDGDGNPRGYYDGGNGAPLWEFNNGGTNNQWLARFKNTTNSGSPYGFQIQFTQVQPDNGSTSFISCADTGATRFIVNNQGDCLNHDNTYTAISDVKLKEQIEDASSQWQDIKNLTVRKYKMKTDIADKGDSNDLWRLGVVAQEVETAGMSGLVYETPDTDEDNNDLGTTTKAVKYSILYMKAVKALQEAMDRIETLEAKVTALENA